MKLNPFRLERFFARHEFSAPYLMCASDCETLTLGELLEREPGARDAFASLRLGYTESRGHPDLRRAIAALYRRISPDQVLVHTGAEEAIFGFMNVALAAGDHIIVHSPHYQSLGEVARGIGAEVSEWRADPERSWQLDLGFLENALTDATRVVVVNFPHNPTGFLPPAGFLSELAALADRHGFLVFSDEVYRGLEYDRAARLPAFADLHERSVSLGVMSKTYGLAGLRIGWVATRNQALLDAMAAFKDYTTICNSAPSEFLATLALRHRESIVERNLEIIAANLQRLDAFFDAHAETFDWHRPGAGPIAFPRLKRGAAETFCRRLVDEAGVLLLPGSLFGDGSNAFRIGFGRRNLPECLEKLAAFVAQYA